MTLVGNPMRPEVLAAAPASMRDAWSGLPCAHQTTLRLRTCTANPTAWLLLLLLYIVHGVGYLHSERFRVWNVNQIQPTNPTDWLLLLRLSVMHGLGYPAVLVTGFRAINFQHCHQCKPRTWQQTLRPTPVMTPMMAADPHDTRDVSADPCSDPS